MKNLVGKAILSVAIASLALSPTLAAAKTRAGDAGASYASTSAPGVGRAAKGEKGGGGTPILLALIAAGLIIGGIVVAADGSPASPPASPGT